VRWWWSGSKRRDDVARTTSNENFYHPNPEEMEDTEAKAAFHTFVQLSEDLRPLVSPRDEPFEVLHDVLPLVIVASAGNGEWSDIPYLSSHLHLKIAKLLKTIQHS
jgi:hypothetical protein